MDNIPSRTHGEKFSFSKKVWKLVKSDLACKIRADLPGYACPGRDTLSALGKIRS